jgi:hypothetical protein
MAKIQTLGLSDDGGKKPSDEPARPEQPSSPPATPSSASETVRDPQVSSAPEVSSTPAQAGPAPEGKGPEWDALVDALTPADAAPQTDWHPKPWVPPAEKTDAAPDWDAIGEAIETIGPGGAPVLGGETSSPDISDLSIHATGEAASMPPPEAAQAPRRGGRVGWIA